MDNQTIGRADGEEARGEQCLSTKNGNVDDDGLLKTRNNHQRSQSAPALTPRMTRFIYLVALSTAASTATSVTAFMSSSPTHTKNSHHSRTPNAFDKTLQYQRISNSNNYYQHYHHRAALPLSSRPWSGQKLHLTSSSLSLSTAATTTMTKKIGVSFYVPAIESGRSVVQNRPSLILSPPQQLLSPSLSRTHVPIRLLASSSETTETEKMQGEEEGGSGGGKSSSKSDEEEWQAAKAAFQMYKAAYGDLKVPSRFVVPSMPPWPESAWGLKLGQRVAAIRATGKYVQGDENRRKVLDEMGFLWRLRAPSPDKKMDGVTFDQIYGALQTYRKHVHKGEGALTVPPNFVVPDCDPWPEPTRGLPLGKKIPTVRLKSYLKANPGAEEKLKKIGFEFDGKVAANDARYKKVYDALVRYKELNGDLLVPQPYVVPEGDDWPEEMWGLRLGARVNAIRSQGTFVKTNPARKDELNELGFEWEPPSAGKKRGRRKKVVEDVLMGPAPPGILEGGVQGKEEKQAPLKDAVSEIPDSAKSIPLKNLPKDASFSPAAAFGGKDPFQLGYEQSQAKAAGVPQWGLEQDPFSAAQAAAAAEQADDVQYIPPKNLTTSLKRAEEMAKSVGVVKGRDEGNRILKGDVKKEIPWFNDDFGGDFVFEDVVEALTMYKEIYGDFSGLDDDSFVVPDQSMSFFGEDPASMSIDVEASAKAAAAIAEAEKAGGGAGSEQLIDTEIQRMEMEMQSSSADLTDEEMEESASAAAAAAAAAAKWPEHLAGMTLGSLVRRIRDGSLEVKHLPDRKAQLDAIDFDWGDPVKFIDVPFDKAMCAMFAYYLIRGDMFVYEDFVMLDEDPWPKALAGFELGKAVFRIRELQNFFEAYHPEKVTMLRMVEFIWFPEIALPLDPSKPKPTDEDRYVVGLGHPLYHINMVPLGVIERIEAEGPWGPEDDQQKWYNYDVVKDYWLNEEDVDDPALYLREAGFEQLAREHEEKYGTSPFTDLEELSEKLEKGLINAEEFEVLKVEAANKLGEQVYNLVRRKYLSENAASMGEEDSTFFIEGDLGAVTEETIEIEEDEDETVEYEDNDVDSNEEYQEEEKEDEMEEEEDEILEEEDEEYYNEEDVEEEDEEEFGIDEEEI